MRANTEWYRIEITLDKGNFSLSNFSVNFLIFALTILEFLKTERNLHTWVPLVCWEFISLVFCYPSSPCPFCSVLGKIIWQGIGTLYCQLQWNHLCSICLSIYQTHLLQLLCIFYFTAKTTVKCSHSSCSFAFLVVVTRKHLTKWVYASCTSPVFT